MILCLAKNDRAAPLFRALAALGPRYVDGGTVAPSRTSKVVGVALSGAGSSRAARNRAQFSPAVLDSLETAFRQRVEEAGKDLTAVLVWGATARPLPRDSNLPYYVVTDGPFDPADPAYPAEWSPGRWAKSYLARQREIFRRARAVFTLSEWARAKVIAVHGLAPASVVRVGWGGVGALCGPLLDPDSTAPLFVSIGNEYRRKGMDILGKAAAILHARHPTLDTLIVGNPADMSIPEGPGLRVIPRALPGPAVQALLRQATASVVASRFDASPHVIFESLQYGTPVIGSPVCGIPEAVDPPFGGAVLERLDPECLAEAMADLYARRSREQREAAYHTYLRHGQWSGVAEKIHAVIGHHLR